MSRHLKDDKNKEKKIPVEEIEDLDNFEDFDLEEELKKIHLPDEYEDSKTTDYPQMTTDTDQEDDDNSEEVGEENKDNDITLVDEYEDDIEPKEKVLKHEIISKRQRADKSKNNKSEKGKKTGLIILVALAVLCLALVLGAYLVSNSDKILPNVYIGGIDVSRLTKDEAEDKLTSENWDKRTTTPMKLSLLSVVDIDIDPIESGFMLSKSEAVEKAYSYGHDGNMFKNLVTFIKALFNSVDINTVNTKANDTYLDTKLTEGFDAMNELYGLQEFYEDFETGVITTRKGWGQIEFDNEDIKTQVGNALRNGDEELKYMTLKKELTMPDFKTLNDKLPKESVDAKYTDDGKFDVVDEVIAADFDVSGAEEIWSETQVGQQVKIPLTVTEPEVTGEELRSQLFRDMLGAMSTRYTNSIENRCSNVRLCASKINEQIVYPGEEFSYNDVVGKRTEEAGFLPAPAYVGLDAEETVKDEIGGGCCQVSSTLYAATLFSFLETVERSNHIYPVNYMMLGIDATVTIPEEGQEVNFKFKNNKNYPIKIVAYTEENETEKKVTVEIWGTLEENDYMPVEFDATYSWTQDYDRFIEKADPDREGYKIKLEIDRYTDAGQYGTVTSTQTWRRVFNSAGELVEETITNLPNPATGEPSMDQYNEHK